MSGENGPVKKIRSNSQKRYIMKPTYIYLDENQTQAAVARRLLRLASVRRAPQSSFESSSSESSILRLRFAAGAAATGLAERDGRGEVSCFRGGLLDLSPCCSTY